MSSKQYQGGLPLYLQVKEKILVDLRNGRYKAGSFLKTEAALCEEHGVSRITVRKAMDELVQEGWIERRSGMGTIVRRREGERILSAGTIGLVIPNLRSMFMQEILKGIESCCRTRGDLLALSLSDGDPEEEISCINHLIQAGIRKLLVLPCDESRLEDTVSDLELNGIHLVLIDRSLEIPYPHSYVGSDNSGGAYAAVRHLHNQGFSRIGFVQHRSSAPSVIQRYQGFRQAVENFHLDSLSESPLFLETLKVEIGCFKDPLPIGLVAVNDQIALEVMGLLKEAGLNVGAEAGLIGFDTPAAADFLEPALTTVLQNPLSIGQRSAEAMIIQSEGEASVFRQILIPTQLLLGKSCGE